jgi:hypothetical protein
MGFGWTNGVALYLLQQTGEEANESEDDDDDDVSMTIKIVVLCVILVTVGVLVVLGYYMYRNFHKGKRRKDSDATMHINILQRDNVKSSLI